MTEDEIKKYSEYSGKLGIDPLRIDEDLIELAVQVLDVAEMAALAVNKRDRLASKLRRVKSEAAHRIRTQGSDKKPSEAFIDSVVYLEDDYVQAEDAYADACVDADLWRSLMDALKIKSSSISRICELTVAGILTPSSVFKSERRNKT